MAHVDHIHLAITPPYVAPTPTPAPSPSWSGAVQHHKDNRVNEQVEWVGRMYQEGAITEDQARRAFTDIVADEYGAIGVVPANEGSYKLVQTENPNAPIRSRLSDFKVDELNDLDSRIHRLDERIVHYNKAEERRRKAAQKRAMGEKRREIDREIALKQQRAIAEINRRKKLERKRKWDARKLKVRRATKAGCIVLWVAVEGIVTAVWLGGQWG